MSASADDTRSPEVAIGAASDAAARERIRKSLDATLVVEAAAGTGKTTALVDRLVALLAAGRARIGSVVALTFTEAAAGELKLRLRAEIGREDGGAGRTPEEQRRLTTALTQLEEARIGTIHSFCADLLREYPIEAGVDPLFEVSAEDVAGDLFDRAFDRWFEGQLEAPGEAVRRILRRRPRRGGPAFAPGSARDTLRSAAHDLREWRDLPARWRPPQGFARESEIDAILAEMTAIGAWAVQGDPEDWFVKSLLEIELFCAEVRRREAVLGRDYDGLEAELREVARGRYWKWRGRPGADTAKFPRNELRTRRDALYRRIESFLEAAGADLAPRLRDELWAVIEHYERLKASAGCLDFLDLLLRARDLLRDHADVRTALQQRFSHVFVDEFQDTDPLQAEILLLLVADDPAETGWRRVRPAPGKLFLVGDPKQSIYRFRRADVGVYAAVKQQVLAAGGEEVQLRVSFRAVPAIQEAVNAAFAPRMRGDSPTQAGYVALAPSRAAHDDQPAVVALPVPRPYSEWGKIVDYQIDRSLPDAVAAFVAWMVRESGWTVTERERPGERVAVAPRHVCILFRRLRRGPEDVARDYVRALEARRIAHRLVGGGSFHAREEIEALRNALGAIERPHDELAVFATLRGPLFALTDSALLLFRETVGPLHPYRRVPADAPAQVRDVEQALGVLRRLHRGRNARPIAETITRLLAATRAQAGLAIWLSGEQALANVARLIEMARRADRRGLQSFRAFVERLQDEAERGGTADAPTFEEGSEGVHITTVHRAKGLEFPVVILADPAAKPTRAEASRWIDADAGLCAMRIADCSPAEVLEHAEEEREREREEADRLLYVAATRARDLLVVPVLADERDRQSWVGALQPAVYPPRERATRPLARSAPYLKSFGRDAVLERPAGARLTGAPIEPGVHQPEAGTHQVVWWDPAQLDLDAREDLGLRQQKLLGADEGNVRADLGVREHASWQEERTRVRRLAAEPSLRIATPTEIRAGAEAAAELATPPHGEAQLATASATPATLDAAGSSAPAGHDVAVESIWQAPPRRPGGKRFGTLVHAVLASVDLDAAPAAIDAACALHGRLLGASAPESSAAREAVERALAHPLLRRAAAAAARHACRRETPLAVEIEGGILVEGIVDAAFLEDEPQPRWTVIDFKTDVEMERSIDAYRRQVHLYALAIERATGLPACGVILQI